MTRDALNALDLIILNVLNAKIINIDLIRPAMITVLKGIGMMQQIKFVSNVIQGA